MIQEVYDIFAQRRYAERKPSRLGSATLGGVVVFALFVHLCCSNTPGKGFEAMGFAGRPRRRTMVLFRYQESLQGWSLRRGVRWSGVLTLYAWDVL